MPQVPSRLIRYSTLHSDTHRVFHSLVPLSNCIRRNEQLLFDTPFLPLSTYLAALIYYKALRHLQKLIYPLFNDILNLLKVIFLIENLVTRFLSRCTFG